MTHRFAPTAAAAALALALAAPAWAQSGAEETAGEAAGEAAAVDPATTVATVNGEPITVGDIASAFVDLPEQYKMAPNSVLYDGLLSQLIDRKLMAQAAEATAIPDDEVVARALQLQRQTLLSDYYMRSQLRARITEERLMETFEAQYGDAEVREVEASHILLETEEAAIAVKAELDGGADFAELAMERSTGPSGPRGGELGWFNEGVMVKPFADAAFAMAVGETSDPVQTQFGWHVIRVTDERSRPVTLDEVRTELAGQMSREVLQEVLDELRAGAEIVSDEAQPGIEIFRDPALTAYP